MKLLTRIILSIGAVLGLAAAPALVVTAATTDTSPKAEICRGSGGEWHSDGKGGGTCTNTNGGKQDFGGFMKQIVNIMLYLIGAIAVIMIVIGAIRYVTSNGDQAAVKSAKDTILYAVIGIIIALMAYAIVNFVVKNV